MDENDLCIRCQKRERTWRTNPKTGRRGRLCDQCFLRAIETIFLELDIQDEKDGVTDDVKATKIVWSRQAED